MVGVVVANINRVWLGALGLYVGITIGMRCGSRIGLQ